MGLYVSRMGLYLSQKIEWLAIRRTQFQKAIWLFHRRMRLRDVLSPWPKYKPMRLFPHQYGKDNAQVAKPHSGGDYTSQMYSAIDSVNGLPLI